jgi:GT2 family glycosyltransferase
MDTGRNQPLVSVVIGNYNGKKYLLACLESIQRQSFGNIEVIFVDDNSRDNSAEFVTKHHSWVRVVQNVRQEKGYGASCDTGAKLAKGKYICFLNPDVELDLDCITYLVERMECMPKIGACGPKLLSLTDKRTLVSTGGFLDIFGFGADRGIDELDMGRFMVTEDVDFITGAVMLVRSDALWAAGGWDVDTFAYAEDSDLCWRMLLLDYRVVYEPKAIAYHAQSPSMGRASPRKIHFMEKNRLASMEKNYSVPTLLAVMPAWSVLAAARLLYFLRYGRADIVVSTVKAYSSSLLNLSKTFRKRAIIQTRRKVGDEAIRKRFSKRSLEVLLLASNQAKSFRK